MDNNRDKLIRYLKLITCKEFNGRLDLLESKNRGYNTPICRHIIIYIARTELKMSNYKAAAIVMRHHTMYNHSIKQINNYCNTDKIFKMKYTNVFNKFKAYKEHLESIGINDNESEEEINEILTGDYKSYKQVIDVII